MSISNKLPVGKIHRRFIGICFHGRSVIGEENNTVEQEKEPSKPSQWTKLWAWTGFGEKKLWDWLQLLSALAIPVVLGAAGFWFTAQQEAHQQAIEHQRRGRAEACAAACAG
jgi:hypothetical protein